MGLFSDIVVGLAVGAAKDIKNKCDAMNEAYQHGLSLSDRHLIQQCNYYKYDAVKRQGYIRALKERFTDYEIREMLRDGILKK